MTYIEPKPTLDWNWAGNEFATAYAETDDPRVLVVIRRDEYATISEAFDGDAINPIYYRGYRDSGHLTFTGGYDDSTVAEAWSRAYLENYDCDYADRFVSIFYGAKVEHVSGGYNPDGEALVFDTAEYREHIGDTADNVSHEACVAIAGEVSKALDGDIYGIGYAVSLTRTTNETPVDLEDAEQEWDVSLECWGFIGDDYAKTSAERFDAGSPDLHPLLDHTNVAA